MKISFIYSYAKYKTTTFSYSFVCTMDTYFDGCAICIAWIQFCAYFEIFLESIGYWKENTKNGLFIQFSEHQTHAPTLDSARSPTSLASQGETFSEMISFERGNTTKSFRFYAQELKCPSVRFKGARCYN